MAFVAGVTPFVFLVRRVPLVVFVAAVRVVTFLGLGATFRVFEAVFALVVLGDVVALVGLDFRAAGTFLLAGDLVVEAVDLGARVTRFAVVDFAFAAVVLVFEVVRVVVLA